MQVLTLSLLLLKNLGELGEYEIFLRMLPQSFPLWKQNFASRYDLSIFSSEFNFLLFQFSF